MPRAAEIRSNGIDSLVKAGPPFDQHARVKIALQRAKSLQLSPRRGPIRIRIKADRIGARYAHKFLGLRN